MVKKKKIISAAKLRLRHSTRRHSFKWPGVKPRGTGLVFASIGLRSRSFGFLTPEQIESSRIAVGRILRQKTSGFKRPDIKRSLKSRLRFHVWVRVLPVLNLTRKSAKSRMGKGKGKAFAVVCPVYPGQILLELRCQTKSIQPLVSSAMVYAGSKLPVFSDFVRFDGVSCGSDLFCRIRRIGRRRVRSLGRSFW